MTDDDTASVSALVAALSALDPVQRRAVLLQVLSEEDLRVAVRSQTGAAAYAILATSLSVTRRVLPPQRRRALLRSQIDEADLADWLRGSGGRRRDPLPPDS